MAFAAKEAILKTFGIGWESGVFRQPHLMVNLLGERFMNEEIMPNTTFTGNAIARQKNRTGFLIFDEAIKRAMEKRLDDVSNVMRVFDARDFDVLFKAMLDGGYKDAFIAESLDELAVKTGIDADGLKATVEQYNSFCEKGYDGQFNKRNPEAVSIEQFGLIQQRR